MRPAEAASFLGILLAGAAAARADEAAAPTPPPPAYALPFQLRPAVAASVVRLDTSVNFYDGKDVTGATHDGTSTASLLLLSYKVLPSLAPLLRVGIVHNTPPAGSSGTAMTNPVIGVIWSTPLSRELKLALFGALALPLGSGGGNGRDGATYAAVGSGVLTRSAFDNALFAVNYTVPFGGADLAWTDHGATVQAEVTGLWLVRTRGDDAHEKDHWRANMTAGMFAGYLLIPELAVGAELRYQRWLSTPAAVQADASKRETVTAGGGVRGNFKLADKRFLRPAVTYSRGLDEPMTAAHMNILQIDLTFAY